MKNKKERVELSIHTTMSQMDGVVDPKALVQRVCELGMRSFAITDHNSVQAFPEISEICNTYCQGRKENSLKVLYGVELDSYNEELEHFHIMALVRNQKGLKNLYELISYMYTKEYPMSGKIQISQKKIDEFRDGLLLGSNSIQGEIFCQRKTASFDDFRKKMAFYDYIEVPTISVFNGFFCSENVFLTEEEAKNYIEMIVSLGMDMGKRVVAVGNVYELYKEDHMAREILKMMEKKLSSSKDVQIPWLYLKTTEEMLQEFSFLGEKTAQKIVVENTNQIADLCEEIEITKPKGSVYFPKIKDSEQILLSMVFHRAFELYENVLPKEVVLRLAFELYGRKVCDLWKKVLCSEEEILCFSRLLHKGSAIVFKETKRRFFQEMKEEEVQGILGSKHEVPFLFAYQLVDFSKKKGYPVESRGGLGSSLVAYFLGLTDVNPLPTHYRCSTCRYSLFENEVNAPFYSFYSNCLDLPERKCPKCGRKLVKDGFDIPCETFLGLDANLLPDININFSDQLLDSVREYAKKVFGSDFVYGAGAMMHVTMDQISSYIQTYCAERKIALDEVKLNTLGTLLGKCKRRDGIHPSRLFFVPSDMEVTDFSPVQLAGNFRENKEKVIQYDLCKMGNFLLNFDLLGHSRPSELKMIEDITEKNISEVPLDDREIFRIFSSSSDQNDTKEKINVGSIGISEFDSSYVQRLLEEISPTSWNELVKIMGISHGTNVWQEGMKDLIFSGVCSFGDIITFRDDIFNDLVRYGVPLEQAYSIMELVGKGKVGRNREAWDKYQKIMREYGVPDWYIASCGKIKYLFPKAHILTYFKNEMRLSWYKVHYPLAFYASYFTNHLSSFDPEVVVSGSDLIRSKMKELNTSKKRDFSFEQALEISLEMLERGFSFQMVDLNRSDSEKFLILDSKTLLIPLRWINGLTKEVRDRIIQEREKEFFLSIEDFKKRIGISDDQVDQMQVMGIFENLERRSNS